MSFWRRLGDVAENLGGTLIDLGPAAPLSLAFSVAKNETLAQAMGFPTYADNIGEKLSIPSNLLINRPIGVLGIQASRADKFGANAWMHHWGDSWNLTGTNAKDTNGNPIAPVSGWDVATDEVKGLFGGPATSFLNDPQAVKDRQAAFQDNWWGRTSSNLMGLALTWKMDPVALGLKGTKAGLNYRVTARPEERAAVLGYATNALNKGQTTKRVQRLGDTFRKNVLQSTDNKDYLQLAADPAIRRSGNLVLAHMFDEINKSKLPQKQAWQQKALVYGAMQGDSKSLQDLAFHRTDVLDKLTRAVSVTATPTGYQLFSLDNHGQAQIEYYNTKASLSSVMAHRRQEITDEITRLSHIDAEAGVVDAKPGMRVAPTLGERAGQVVRTARLHESILYDGPFGRPVRVVTGAIGARVPMHIDVYNPVSGLDEMTTILRRSSMSPATRTSFLTDFGKAVSPEQRLAIVSNLEDAIWSVEGKRYGKQAEEVRALAAAAKGVRRQWQIQLKSRAYSGKIDDPAIVIDSNGVAHAFDKPFLQSHIANTVAITDPKAVQWALRKDSQTRFMERLARRTPGGSVTVAKHVTNAAEYSKNFLDDLGTLVMEPWKFVALLRGGYPVRVQVDEQLRNLVAMGPAAYFASAGRGISSTVRNVPERFKGQPRLQRYKHSDLTRPEFVDRNGNQIPIAPAQNQGELRKLQRILDDQEGAAELFSGASANARQRGLSEHGWEIVTPSDKNWGTSHMRVVNQQFRNSPVAMRVLQGLTDKQIAMDVTKNAAMWAEWSNFSAAFQDIPEWVHHVRGEVTRVLPTPELRAIAANRDMQVADYGQHFASVEKRMKIHGTQYSYIAPDNAVLSAYRGVREAWFKHAAAIPENVMARHPLYNHQYRVRMKSALANIPDDAMLTTERIDNIRRAVAKRTVKDISEILFDTTQMSQGAYTFRHVSPFYGAWEDMMRKWGKLFYENPQLLARYNTVRITADNMPSYKDENGRGYFVIPSALVPFGNGEDLYLRKDSFNAIMQGDPWWAPGLGPLVQIPVNGVAKQNTALAAEVEKNPLLRWILPFGVQTDPWYQQLAPAYAKQLMDKRVGSPQYQAQWAQMKQDEMSKYRSGERKTAPTNSEIAKRVSNHFILSALLDVTMPFSVKPDTANKLQFYRDVAHSYENEYNQNPTAYKAANQGMDWRDKFDKDFPEYYAYTMSLSKNETGIVASIQAMDSAKRNAKDIAENPDLGWFFVGADNIGSFNSGIYSYQKANTVGGGSKLHFREQRDPAAAARQIEAEQGWQQYNQAMTAVNMELERRGLHSIQQKGAADLLKAKQDYIAQLATYNKDWRDDYLSRDNGKVDRLVGIAEDKWASDPTFAKRPDQQALQMYVTGRQQIRDILAARASHGLDSPANQDVRVAWDTYVTQLKAYNIGFEQMYNRVLDGDDMNRGLLGIGNSSGI